MHDHAVLCLSILTVSEGNYLPPTIVSTSYNGQELNQFPDESTLIF